MSNRKKLKPWRRPVPVQESATAVADSPLGITEENTATLPAERVLVREAAVGSARPTAPGRMLVRLIKAGISKNGNAYSPKVLREAAANRRWAKGCPTFVDHATDEEDEAQPAGSIKNLAGVLAEDARWDEATQSLVAEVRLFHPWRETLTDMAESIGMSIRSWLYGEHGEYEGQHAFVVSSIEVGRSVDFVTAPAAGGAILSVLEAVGNKVPTAEARNVAHWMESRIHADFTNRADDMFGDGRLTREERIVLSGAVGDALSAFSARIEQDAPQLLARDLWQEPDPVIAAAAEVAEQAPAEVEAAEPTAEPPAPAEQAEAQEDVTDGTPPTALASTEQEPAMSGQSTGAPPVEAGTAPVVETPAVVTTESTQATAPAPAPAQPDYAAIVAEAVRSATAPLVEQVQQMQARESARDAETRGERNRQRAREAVDSALRASDYDDVRSQIGPRVTGTVLASVPTTAEGAVDEARLAEAITAAATAEATFVRQTRAEALEAAGVGSVFGLGGSAVDEAEKDTSGVEEALSGLFSTIGLTSEQAAIATKGRGF